MPAIPSLVHDGVYKIICVATGTLMTLVPAQGNRIEGQHDKNEKTQLWRAELIGGETWKLKNEGSGLYLDYTEGNFARGNAVVGGHGGHAFNILQWKTHGGAEYRIWFPGGPDPGYLVDLADGRDSDGTAIHMWDSNDTSAQFWLFQRIPA